MAFRAHFGLDGSKSSTFFTKTPPSSTQEVLRSTVFLMRFVFFRRLVATAASPVLPPALDAPKINPRVPECELMSPRRSAASSAAS